MYVSTPPPPSAAPAADTGQFDAAVGGDGVDGILAAGAVADEPPVRRRKLRTSDILILILAVLLMAGGAVFAFQALSKTSDTNSFSDMANHRVVPDDTSALDPNFQKAADAVPDVGKKFIIESVNLNVPLGEVNEVDGVMNPPGFTSAYLVRNRGVSLDNADQGTVYVVAHALRPPGVAPGNFVTNLASGTVTVAPGALIQVGDRTYQMVSSEVVAKGDLGSDAALWANTPGMLVFVTCMETSVDSSGHAVNNAVIVGQLVS